MRKCRLIVALFLGNRSKCRCTRKSSRQFESHSSARSSDCIHSCYIENTDDFYQRVERNIKQQNFGLDLPFLLSSPPSVLTTSDAGAGIGYTSIRIRGTDATRINITTNGIPLNDAESHSIFWVNTPDFASSLEDTQVQRGVGTSTNGSGALGGSINMRTQGIASNPYAEVSGSYGSFQIHKETVKVGTGIINKH